ncbi:MAG: PfkB family carbohydrate kinase, partial [Puniceicoccales bacterium]|nr:PfkB family carbohydrate kinase [Puniceicoccales bacterium]
MEFVQKNVEWRKFLQEIGSAKILVVGDVMLDHYLWGEAHRLSPEAPVPVLRVTEDTYRLGGAANVALNIRHLGGTVKLWGWVGKDEGGRRVKDLLAANGVALCRTPNYCGPTIVKTRVVAQNQQLCRLDRDTDFPLLPNADLIPCLREALEDIEAVILSDYAKGTLSQALVNQIACEVEARGLL